MPGFKLYGALLLSMVLSAPLQAGQYQLVQGRVNVLPLLADVKVALDSCNLSITVQDQPPLLRELRAPLFMTELEILPQDATPVRVRWQGQTRRLENGQLLAACPTAGEALHTVVTDVSALRQGWQTYLNALGPERAECMRLGLPLIGVRPEIFDRKDPQTSVTDQRVLQMEQQCEAFVALPKAWGKEDERRHACTLAGGLKTFCEGIYLRPGDARRTPIPKVQALALHLKGQHFVTAVQEHNEVRSARQARQRREIEREKAMEAERLRIEEQAREQQAQQEREAQAQQQAQEQARREQEAARRQQQAQERERAEAERKAARNWFVKTWEDSVMARLRPEAKVPATPAQAAAPSAPASSASAAGR